MTATLSPTTVACCFLSLIGLLLAFGGEQTAGLLLHGEPGFAGLLLVAAFATLLCCRDETARANAATEDQSVLCFVSVSLSSAAFALALLGGEGQEDSATSPLLKRFLELGSIVSCTLVHAVWEQQPMSSPERRFSCDAGCEDWRACS